MPISVSNRPFALWHHFTTTTRILQGFGFLCKLGLLLFKPHIKQNLNMKGKTKRILVVAVKWRHRANDLFLLSPVFLWLCKQQWQLHAESTERLPAIKIAPLCILGPPLTVSCGSSTYSRLTFVLLMTFPLLTRPCSANVPVRVMVPVWF